MDIVEGDLHSVPPTDSPGVPHPRAGAPGEQKHEDASEMTGDPLFLPPIPLASGQVFLDADGVPHRAVKVELVITAEDGVEKRVALDERLGGWWAPPAI